MKKASRFITISIIAIVIAIGGFRDLRSEHVFLKDGSIVSGTIVVDAAKSLTVKKKEGKMETVPRDKIMRILYTELYMGKVFIRMNDGTVKSGYLVDEDQTTYTFRKDLYKVDEFTVQREKVLFIARTNPTDLTGEPGPDEIALKWSPPFQPAKAYRVYLKTQAADFKVARETGGTDCVIDDLKSNSKYWIKVTALDHEGVESMPSNQIEVTTSNFPPKRPADLVLVKIPAGQGKGEKRTLQWKASTDPDGTIKEYRIYQKTDKGPEKIAATPSLSYDLPAGANPILLSVRAVDDRGEESNDRMFYPDSPLHLRLGCTMAYPFGTLDRLVGPGFGCAAGVYVTGFLFDNLAFGLDVGYLYWLSDRDLLSSMHMIPVSAWAGWRFWFLDDFRVIPAAHFGVVTILSFYESMGESGLELMEEREKIGAEFTIGASATLEYSLTPAFFLFLKGDYTMIIETEELQHRLGIDCGAGMNLL